MDVGPGVGVGATVGAGVGVGATVGAGVGVGIGATSVPTMSARSAVTTKSVEAGFFRPVTRIVTVCVVFESVGVAYTSACSSRVAE